MAPVTCARRPSTCVRSPSRPGTETNAPSVDVVGYSAGGVVARLWVRDYGGAGLARRVMTLGSPHHGTSQAALGRELAGGCPVACEQLVPDSDLLRRLNAGDETPDGPLWATVRSTGDQVVTPVDSAALDGAVNILVQEVCPGATAQPRRAAGASGDSGGPGVGAWHRPAGATAECPLLTSDAATPSAGTHVT